MLQRYLLATMETVLVTDDGKRHVFTDEQLARLGEYYPLHP